VKYFGRLLNFNLNLGTNNVMACKIADFIILQE